MIQPTVEGNKVLNLDKILSRLLRESEGSNRVDVVFDLYRDIPIKLAERELRGVSDAIKNLAAGQKVKQVKNFFYAMVTTKQVLSDLDDIQVDLDEEDVVFD